jgi:hypothetical protein
MAITPEGRDPQSDHRRDTFNWIVLPMAGGVLLIAAGVGAALLMPQRLQVSVLSDWLLTITLLCPVMLCLLPLCILLVVMAAGMNKVHGAASRFLVRIEKLTPTFTNRIIQTMNIASSKSISWRSRLAYFENLLDVFERPPSPEDTNGKPNP